MYQKPPLRKLRSQLVYTFLLGSVGIVTAIGIPALLLLNRQTSSQTNLLMNQAILTTQASLAREEADLRNLALLVSQRPTLIQLLENQDKTALEGYLETLRRSVNLDSLIICKGDEEVIGSANYGYMAELCTTNSSSGFEYLSSEEGALMFAAADLQDIQLQRHKVLIGKTSFSVLNDLQEDTGLLYILIWRDEIIASSDTSIEPNRTTANQWMENANLSSSLSISRRSLHLDGAPYVLSHIAISPETELSLVGALNVREQVTAQQELTQTLISALLLIVALASGLGIWFSQRLSYPLNSLANAAADFRQGNLHSPVSIQSTTWEISQLANALEDARVALEHSMQQLQGEKAWIEHVLNSIIEGMITLDHQSRITFASVGMSKIAGLEPERMIGQRVDQIFFPLESEISLTEQLPDAGQQRRISVKLKNGQERLLSISKAKLVPPDARTSNQALVIRDVSNEEYIHRLLGDFMANITHEFRTPLAALEASSELMLDNLESLSKPEIEELLVSLNLGIINLQTLIDNLIEAASIEAGRFKVSVQDVPFATILKDALEIVQPLSDKYGLKLTASCPTEGMRVSADRRRTVQVLVNLVSNAIKHSPNQAEILVNCFVSDESLRVEISDQGAGIPADKRNNLFKRFAHLESANEHGRQGAGLGLSVVKAIVEAQHGEVGIFDRPEGGTSFWFTVPLAGEEIE